MVYTPFRKARTQSCKYHHPPPCVEAQSTLLLPSLFRSTVLNFLPLCSESASPAVPEYVETSSSYFSLSDKRAKLLYNACAFSPALSSSSTISCCLIEDSRCNFSLPSQNSLDKLPNPSLYWSQFLSSKVTVPLMFLWKTTQPPPPVSWSQKTWNSPVPSGLIW